MPDSDAPDTHVVASAAFKDAATYDEALKVWKSPEDVNDWIGARFKYDHARSRLLSETQRARSAAPDIYPPQEFFTRPEGVCVDLARLGVESLQSIAPQLDPKYLMIEFDPATLNGNVLRRHWVAFFKREEGLYFFADSKRPGYMAGPYKSVQAYLEEYSRYRGRTIVSVRELATYKRRMRTPASKQLRTDA
jgi:hypothetical protein